MGNLITFIIFVVVVFLDISAKKKEQEKRKAEAKNYVPPTVNDAKIAWEKTQQKAKQEKLREELTKKLSEFQNQQSSFEKQESPEIVEESIPVFLGEDTQKASKLSGMKKVAKLPALQKAVIMAEILGKAKALR